MNATGGALLIYGANGYNGRLIVERAVSRGLRPIVSGRNAAEIESLAAQHGLQSRVASLDDAASLDTALSGCSVVIHSAGPFSRTSKPMVDACIRNRAHYLDITGEISVFETLASGARSAEAKAAGVMLLPGSGFDVVPSDCLAAHLHRRLPTATWLTLAFSAGTGLSRGTATTMLENIERGGAIRRKGKISRVPAAWRRRDIDFGDRTRRVVTLPWGDVSTAFHSTGIPNIEVYTAANESAVRAMIASRYIGWLLATEPAQHFLKDRIKAGAAGPTAAQRSSAVARLWGEAWDDDGRRVVARLRTPDGYTLTALTTVAAAEKVFAGGAKPGFQTPSRAFGADFILEIEGTEREDVTVAPEQHR
ncbi:MAG TPA: saccharopine dehydrogenase NADP-binding domain-containing protein [Gemmatimonadaceae bacterium]|nr:saccharopine dehydrogenase NADP-binding domain-containing protein [Gemmatimonadaceae bacterium]